MNYLNLDLKDIEGEIWKDVKNFEGTYMVSSKGRVKTLNRKIMRNGNKTSLKSRIRKQKINKHTGYLMVGLNSKGKSKNFTIHSLMGEAFLGYERGKGIKSSSNCVNHLDGNKLNNNLENFEVISIKENVRHAFEIGLIKAHKVEYLGKKYCSKSNLKKECGISEIRMNKLIKNKEIILIN